VLNADVRFVTNQEMPDGMKQKVLDVSIQQNLGWSPSTSLTSGIEKTYKHFLEVVNE
jgi:GDP-L-fucose synthase